MEKRVWGDGEDDCMPIEGSREWRGEREGYGRERRQGLQWRMDHSKMKDNVERMEERMKEIAERIETLKERMENVPVEPLG